VNSRPWLLRHNACCTTGDQVQTYLIALIGSFGVGVSDALIYVQIDSEEGLESGADKDTDGRSQPVRVG